MIVTVLFVTLMHLKSIFGQLRNTCPQNIAFAQHGARIALGEKLTGEFEPVSDTQAGVTPNPVVLDPCKCPHYLSIGCVK